MRVVKAFAQSTGSWLFRDWSRACSNQAIYATKIQALYGPLIASCRTSGWR